MAKMPQSTRSLPNNNSPNPKTKQVFSLNTQKQRKKPSTPGRKITIIPKAPQEARFRTKDETIPNQSQGFYLCIGPKTVMRPTRNARRVNTARVNIAGLQLAVTEERHKNKKQIISKVGGKNAGRHPKSLLATEPDGLCSVTYLRQGREKSSVSAKH